MLMPASSFNETNPGVLVRVGDQLIRCDSAMTQKAYADITTDSAAECGCSYCRNFITQRATVYPQSFLDFLAQLGIDHTKEDEVFEYGPEENGKRLYGGWFFFTGQMIETGERQVEQDGIKYWIQPGKNLPRPNGEFGFDLLAVDFTLQVPWVLEEQP